jgi:hypothetical protein
MSMERLTMARQSGKSDKDLQLLIAQSFRQQAEHDDAVQLIDEKISRLKALRRARDAKPARS